MTCQKLPYYPRQGEQRETYSFFGGVLEKERSALKNRINYDSNGNMTQDLNKGITEIKYNYLNLPQTVTKNTGEYIKYIYDAAGVKLAQEVYDASNNLIKKTDYVGEFIYEDDALAMIQHEEGRIVPDALSGNFEYQYYLKDHLGNNRVTFTTKPKTHLFTLDYEGLGNDDQDLFEDVTVQDNDIFDHTDPTGTIYTKTQWLNAAEGSRTGSAIAIPVGTGDILTASVFAKYVEITSSPTDAVTSIAGALVGAFTGSSGATNEFGNSTITNNFGSGSLIGGTGFPVENGSAPYAFLNVMFLPAGESIDLVKDATFAYDQIDISAAQPIGQPKNTNYDELRIDGFTAPSQGYALVYLSNESNTLVDVHFDDLQIEVIEHPVIQKDDFYPFGLTFNSYNRVTAKENKFKYNGKEEQEEWAVLDYGFRMYDPAISRWSVQDAHAESYYEWSPYNYVMNNPINMIDLLGLDPVYRDGTYYETNDDGEEYEVDWNYVQGWLQDNDHIGASYSFASSGSGTIITETKKGKTNSFNYNGNSFSANSMATLMGRDDRDNSIGAFSGIETLDGLGLENILGHATSIFYDIYKGNVELAVLEQSIGGMLDYKNKLYDILSIDRASLVEINGTTYNANEAGNFLWGMVIEYAGGLISPNTIAELGTRGRNDESWEQKAITSGRNYALELLKRDDNFKRQVLSQRIQFRTGDKKY